MWHWHLVITMCRSWQCRGFCLPDVEIHSVPLEAVFACQSFGKHNVPLVAVPRFLPAGVLVSNHCVLLVAMPRFLPAGCGNLQCAACGSFCLPEFW